MSESVEKLVEKIVSLPREKALEAVLALKDEFEGTSAPSAVVEPGFTAAVRQHPYQHVQEVDELAHLFLIVAALDEDRRERVRSVVEAVGRKAFIFGGTEIAIVAGAALVGLQMVLSRGKSSETELKITEKEVVYRNVQYGISKTVAGLLPQFGSRQGKDG